jgi:uncharacterized protein (DUF885 family)
MSRFSPKCWYGLALLALAGCGAASGPAAPAKLPALQTPPNEQLGRLVERYWDEHSGKNNAIAPQTLADSLSIERRYLAEVLNIPRDRLDPAAALTYDIFRRQRELDIEGFTFPAELLPINPFWGMPQQFAARASSTAVHPLSSAGYQDWLLQIDEYVRWTQQAAVNMREGIRRGYVSPRALIQRMLPILERLGLDDSANVFYVPLRFIPETIKEPERGALTKALSQSISQKLLPANRALHDFLQQEYLPRTRAGIALSELPLGNQWYAFRIKRAVGAALSPDEISRIGAAEVERLGSPNQARDGAPQVRDSALQTRDSAPPPAAAQLTGPELASAYQAVEVQVRAAMPGLFSDMPNADFDIRTTEWLPNPADALHYQPAGEVAPKAAALDVRAGKDAPKVSIAQFLQQGLPGHHLQIALQQERSELPRFRRFGTEAAFTEGWGLYAVSLGESLSVYPDEPAKADAAAVEMRCAVALVVDTAIHAKGWTRARALEYLHAHLGMEDRDAQAMIDWYAANPADGLACMMGGLKFRALRARAQQTLGARFDLRGFHTEVLRDGAVPLDLLEAKMKSWAEASK